MLSCKEPICQLSDYIYSTVISKNRSPCSILHCFVYFECVIFVISLCSPIYLNYYYYYSIHIVDYQRITTPSTHFLIIIIRAQYYLFHSIIIIVIVAAVSVIARPKLINIQVINNNNNNTSLLLLLSLLSTIYFIEIIQYIYKYIDCGVEYNTIFYEMQLR